MAYLFVHFREKTTPDGEQVYFGLSRDGYHWTALNDGKPVLWCFYGDRGARDYTIKRVPMAGKADHFYLFGTDLSLSYGMRSKYHQSWEEISVNGSDAFSFWESENLTDWSEQRLVRIGTECLGCRWAPDILYDRTQGDYLLHWSSPLKREAGARKAIYYSRTADFKTYTEPRVLYAKEDASIIDSAIYEEDGRYYLFVKSDSNPIQIILLAAARAEGPYERVPAFDRSMRVLEGGQYEAPTAVRLKDGKWALFLDYYGVRGAGQGYVPFLGESLAAGHFVRADGAFSFPYRFKHGTILPITEEEYDRMAHYDWTHEGYW